MNLTAANTGLISTCVHVLAINPQAPDTLYAGTEGGVFKSIDGGGNWTAASTGLTSPFVNTMAVNPKHRRPFTLELMAVVSSKVYMAGPIGPCQYRSPRQCCPNHCHRSSTPETLYAGMGVTSSSGIFKSIAAERIGLYQY